MMSKLFLKTKYRAQIKALLEQQLPNVSAWAYGSRVNNQAHDCSDLDLVLRTPDLTIIDFNAFNGFIWSLKRSNVPILIDVHDWARLPDSFQQQILKNYVIL